MKLAKYISIVLCATALVACEKMMNELEPQGGTLLQSQVEVVNTANPARVEAAFSGLFTPLGQPAKYYTNRADDWGFLMMFFSNDQEAADVVTPDSDYNWFSVCGEYTSRNPDYANPYLRYNYPYNTISNVNDFLKSFPADTKDPDALAMMAQARALRAYSYLMLAPSFQFTYGVAADKPCVPLVTEKTEDFTHNPRATVKAVYDFIIEDLNYAIEHLEGYERSSAAYIDQQVAYGLRARANLVMENWEAAAADAAKAAAGYTPASIEEVSKPSFMDISEHNWLWGYDMTTSTAATNTYCTTTSWLRSFSGDGYAPATQVYAMINVMLYNKIPDTDVRKGWWVDKNLESPLLEGLSWNNEPVATVEIDDVKLKYLPYTNVKFGTYTVGTTTNDEDFPFMRVEEMILIQAEALVKGGDVAGGTKVLEDFVKTYRDPSYSAAGRGLSIEDEIWFQRRIELWGEGFGISDTKRLNKPVVRIHAGAESNVADAFAFNLKADDPWLLMRFPKDETNTNFSIVNNTGGSQPVRGQNGDIRDGVTD